MTLRHLEVFRAVCARESITLAAEHLNMTQPAVSLAVKELEAFYGVQLLERMNRRIYITDAGRRLLQHADAVTHSVRRVRPGPAGQRNPQSLQLRYDRHHRRVPPAVDSQPSGPGIAPNQRPGLCPELPPDGADDPAQ